VKIHTDFSAFQHLRHPVVTIGTFDGVHPGHLAIVRRLRELAAEHNGESVLLTFYPHPRMVLHPEDHGLSLLSTPEEKADLLRKAGVEHLMVYPFSVDFSKLSAFDYVRDLLVNGLHARTVVVGYDHRFGKNREGDFSTLVELSETFGFEVEEIPAQLIDSIEVSSTKIRNLLRTGEVQQANAYLGYTYSFSGEVIHGDGLGRKLGFPTANLRLNYPYKLLPGRGVYKVSTEVMGQQFPAVLNIGLRPTVASSSEERVEVHIPQFNADLYNQTLSVSVVSKLRDEKKFGSIDDLKQHIQQDIDSLSKGV
jgi:riboflavin kinase / FMN adenylyltransferase